MEAADDLGRAQPLTAGEIMSRIVVSVHEDTRVEAVARLMLARDLGCVLVLDGDERMCGIITESDFTAKERSLPFSTERSAQILGEWVGRRGAEAIYASCGRKSAAQIMSAPVVTVSEQTPVKDVVQLMFRKGIVRVPVLHKGRVVGAVTRRDLLKLVVQPPMLSWYPGAEEGRGPEIAAEPQPVAGKQQVTEQRGKCAP